jgi:hypothetical protein
MKSKKKSKSTKLPSMQFYPGDWKKDPGIKSLSIAARGLWFEMLLIMWEAENRGYLVVGNVPMNSQQLARNVGIDRTECEQLLKELEEVNIYSRSDEIGVIYCRRMVKDEKVRLAKCRAGVISGEQRRNKRATEEATNPGSSSSSSSSLSSSSSTSIDTYTEKRSDLSPQRGPSPSLDGGDQSLDWSPPSLKSGSPAAMIASAYLRQNPGIISQEKATKQTEFYLARGMKATEAEAAVSKPSAKGKHIWDIFKPITPIPKEEEKDYQSEVFKMFIEEGNKPKAKRGAK